MLKKITLPIQLLLIILLVWLFGSHLNYNVIKGCYTFSLIFKDLLTALLPFIIFSFISTGFLSFKNKAHIIFSTLLIFIIISNTIAAFFSFFLGKITLRWLVSDVDTSYLSNYKPLFPFFEFKIPTILSSEKAMLLAVFVGILLSFINMPKIEDNILKLKSLIEKILKKFIIPLLPFYVLGFLLKVQYEGAFKTLFRSYGKTFFFILALQAAYVLFMYLIAANFNFKKTLFYIKNMIPSYIMSFSTMSSTVTIPITIKGSNKNINNKPLADLAIPILANIHLLGAGLKLPILSLVTMKIFLGISTDIVTFSIFVFYFSIMLLATTGVPGGGIIVMAPVLVNLLGFSPEMVSAITTLYILQDSFGTATNVVGDGALLIMINKALIKIGVFKKQIQS